MRGLGGGEDRWGRGGVERWVWVGKRGNGGGGGGGIRGEGGERGVVVRGVEGAGEGGEDEG